MEFPSFEMPQIPVFQIPYNPRTLKFTGGVMDKQRFQKLQIDRKLIKAFNNHLSNHIDKDVLFYLKFLGQGDSLIKYQNNKVGYYRNRQLLNAGVAPFEYPVDANTLALYHLNESAGGNAIDSCGNFLGTATGTTVSEGRVMSPARYFDGNDDKLDCGDVDLPADFTIEGWYKPTAQKEGDVIFMKATTGNAYTIPYNISQINSGAGCVYYFYVGGGGTPFNVASSTTVNALNKWVHIAGTIRGTAMKIWVNGVVEGTATYTGTRQNTALSLYLGWGTGATYFAGNMDEIRISNVARTQFGGISPGGVIL